MPTLKELIETRLQCLKGVPFTKATRASNMECFHFGKERPGSDRKGDVINISDFTLHVQCAWRLAAQEGIIAGRQDMYHPAANRAHSVSDFDWEEQGANRCDQRMTECFETNKGGLLVLEITADIGGAQ